MAKLHFLLEGNSLGEFALDRERITIGRRPSNQIHIDNLTVSGEHAVVVTIGKDSFLEDLNSTNGTIINGTTVKKHVLQHGDVIEFGKYQLRYINESQISNKYDDGFEKTMMITPTKQAKPAKEHVIKKQAEEVGVVEKVFSAKNNIAQIESIVSVNKPYIKADSPTATNIASIGRLQLLSGVNIGHELVLNKTMTTLGKPGSQVAVINRRPSGYFITHVVGNSFPIVNGQAIGVQAYALNHRDVVELAGTKMEFSLT